MPVWAFGEQRPAGFWARRMTHETTVHRVDAQLTVPGGDGPAAGGQPVIAADVAADGIDEWLTSVAAPDGGEPDVRAEGLAEGSPCTCTRRTCPGAPASGWSATTRPGSPCAGSTRRPPWRSAAARPACCWSC